MILKEIVHGSKEAGAEEDPKLKKEMDMAKYKYKSKCLNLKQRKIIRNMYKYKIIKISKYLEKEAKQNILKS